MAGWHQRLNRHEFEQLQEMVKDREPWHAAAHGVIESDTTEQLVNNRCGGKTPFLPQGPEPHDIRSPVFGREQCHWALQVGAKGGGPRPCPAPPTLWAGLQVAAPPQTPALFCCLSCSLCAVLEGAGGAS